VQGEAYRPVPGSLAARAYWAVAAALGIFLLAQALNEPWDADFWVHLGTVREMAERPWHPTQPLVGVDIEDPLLSPYMLLLGLVSRWSGAEAVTVLVVAGFINLGLFLYAFRRLVLVVTGNRGAPVWALLFTLLAWGIAPWQWSGYFSLSSIGFVLPYPSMFATALALVALSSTHQWLVRGHRRELALVGLAVPIVLLTHVFTAAWSAIAGLAIVASLVCKDRAGRLFILTGVVGMSAGLALLWPYYSLLSLFRVAGQFDPVHRPLYGLLAARSFLALPGVVALWLRARRNLRDALVWTFAGTTVVFVLGGLSGRWSLGRVFPGMMVAAHIALGDFVAKLRMEHAAGTRRHRQVTAAVAGLLVVGFAGSYPGLIHAGRLEAFRPLSNVIGADDRVVASFSLNLPVGGISGDVLVPPVPTFLDDVDERNRDAMAILSPLTKQEERQELIDQWDIRILVLTPEDASRLSLALDSVAAVVLETDDYVVLDTSVVPNSGS
jgi:hypothetical protein